MTAASILTPPCPELTDPEVKVAVATPVASVKATTGVMDSPPPVGVVMEKATLAFPTGCDPVATLVRTVARRVVVLLNPPVLRPRTLKSDWREICAASVEGAKKSTKVKSCVAGAAGS